MILAVMNAIYAIAYIEAWKSDYCTWVWARDLAIPVQRSNQLSYINQSVENEQYVSPTTEDLYTWH